MEARGKRQKIKACTHWGTNVVAHCMRTKLLDVPRQVEVKYIATSAAQVNSTSSCHKRTDASVSRVAATCPLIQVAQLVSQHVP
jgi:hypothetical protein